MVIAGEKKPLRRRACAFLNGLAHGAPAALAAAPCADARVEGGAHVSLIAAADRLPPSRRRQASVSAPRPPVAPVAKGQKVAHP
jgi:hypothetical protein